MKKPSENWRVDRCLKQLMCHEAACVSMPVYDPEVLDAHGRDNVRAAFRAFRSAVMAELDRAWTPEKRALIEPVLRRVWDRTITSPVGTRLTQDE